MQENGTMGKDLKLSERLIVGADFRPDPNKGQGRSWVRDQVLKLTEELEGTGIFIKTNSALRACGYSLIDEVHAAGLLSFADLKGVDISETLGTDGVLLREAKPELVTAMCTAGVAALRSLKDELPNSEILGVTVLTSLNDGDTDAMFSCSVEEAVMRFARVAAAAGVDGFISSAKEAPALRAEFGPAMTLNTPAIRPEWSFVEGDDQNRARAASPTKAIRAGADRIVVSRPILQAKIRRDAVQRTLEEISKALESRMD
jgi:orotidine-5'-phosphate decarboxylase